MPALRSISTLVFFYCLFSGFTGYGQSVASSPYSAYGLGETYLPGLNYNTGFGFGGSALDSNLHVNLLNPAGLAGLQYATFEGSVATRNLFIQDQRGSGYKNNTNLDHLVFGLPIKKRAGVSFGLTPYTGVAVNQNDTVNIDGYGRINFHNVDSGGTNKAFLATGIGVGKFAFGVEGSYIFGNIQRQRDVRIVDDPAGLNVSRAVYTKVSGFTYKAGAHFKTILRTGYRDTIPDSLMRLSNRISKSIHGTRLALAVTYEPAMLVNGETSMTTYHFASSGTATPVVKENVGPIPGTFYSPQGGSVGIAINKGKWTTVADFSYRQWSKFRTFEARDTILENGEATFSGSDSLTDGWRASLGFQLHPDATSNKFFSQSKYRFGGYYRNVGLRINNVEITEYALTLGWGIPLRRAYANGPIPIIEASVALGERGSLNNGLTRERFITARIGVTISDKWFVRRKFD